MNFEPLRITFDMQTPIALPLKRQPYPIHLDSLLIGILTASKKEIFENIHKDKYAPGLSEEVPLAVYGDKSPIYCASVAMAAEMQRGKYEITKKLLSPEEIRMYKSKEDDVYPSKDNRYRQWLEEVITLCPKQIIFECQGDRKAIMDLLSQVRRIGVFRRVGMGEVINIHINQISNPDAGLIYNDQPARMLPVADWPDKPWRKTYAAVRAPYWYPGNKELCWAPPVETTVPNITVVDL